MPSKKKKSERPALIAELIVRRGALRRFARLKDATADLPVTVSWDRRVAAQRADRKGERRRRPPLTWDVADFVVVAKRKRTR